MIDYSKGDNTLNQGSLIVRVFTGLGSYPVEGAFVTIMSENTKTEEEEVEAVLRTDDAGIAGPILLDSGTFDFTTPGTDNVPVTYTVEVNKPGNFGVVRYGVAVYPGQTSIQTIFTVALPFGASETGEIFTGTVAKSGVESSNA